MLFLVTFLALFCHFFFKSGASARSARALTRVTEAVCGKPGANLVLSADFLPPCGTEARSAEASCELKSEKSEVIFGPLICMKLIYTFFHVR